MGMEHVGSTAIISCDACRAVCVVGSDDAFTAQRRAGHPEAVAMGEAAVKTKIRGRVYIVVRKGQVDRRHRRTDRNVRLVDQVVQIREYPYLCDDCYETGGYDGLAAAGWEPLHQKLCESCGALFGHEDASRLRCERLACKSAQ